MSVSELLKEANSKSGAPDDITDTSDIIKPFGSMDEGFESPSLTVRQRELFPVILIPVCSCVHLCAMFQHVSVLRVGEKHEVRL